MLHFCKENDLPPKAIILEEKTLECQGSLHAPKYNITFATNGSELLSLLNPIAASPRLWKSQESFSLQKKIKT